MTQEEKAKAYDEALEVLKEKFADKEVCGLDKSVLQKLFPQLKESEDERTWIINYLSNRILNSTIIAEKENLKNAIAWLEKQDEKDEEILILKDQIESLHAAIKAIRETHRIELEKLGKNNMGISEATKQKLEDSLNKALEKETPESWNKFLDEQDELDKESEDEKIRQFLIHEVAETSDKVMSYRNMNKKAILAWLEKQSKQKSIEYPLCKTVKDKIDYYIVNHFTTDTVIKTDVNSIVKAMEEGVMIGMNEQKPADTEKGAKGNEREIPNSAWSEEDEARFKSCIKILQPSDGYDTINTKWLKDLKERVQLQDTAYYNPYKEVVESIAEMCKHYDKASHSGLRDFYDNIKVKCKDAKEYDSLFPQSIWKPSDEQMEILQYLCENSLHPNKKVMPTLKSLYQDLKKLREE